MKRCMIVFLALTLLTGCGQCPRDWQRKDGSFPPYCTN